VGKLGGRKPSWVAENQIIDWNCQNTPLKSVDHNLQELEQERHAVSVEPFSQDNAGNKSCQSSAGIESMIDSSESVHERLLSQLLYQSCLSLYRSTTK